ncbi:hypothetical protein AGMMS50229_10590 [Campylobacterota bacterium]|nr:hypothetical protein AGMMS50229_10590 [Campylobacterota bacterium]
MATICAYCGTGCEIVASVERNTILAIDGDPSGAVSKGKLCVKGRFGFDFVASPSRITGARIRRSFIDKNRDRMPAAIVDKLFLLTPLDHDFFAADTDIAIATAAWKTGEILREFGAKSFGCIGGARTSCESAYFFQKFAREIIGTPHIDNCARVCHSPSLEGLSRTLGRGAASNPFEDIFAAELIVVIGSNTTEAHPIVGLKILEAARRGATLAVIDTRTITLSKTAQFKLTIPYETNLLALNAMAKTIALEGLFDASFIAERTENFDDYLAAIGGFMGAEIFRGVAGYEQLADDLPKLARLIATKRTLFVWGLGVTEQIDGSDTVSAIANLALLSGNIGKRGAGVMPLRGQNNVQGACDMGVLPYYGVGYSAPQEIGLTTPQMIDAALGGEIRAIFNMGEDIAHIHPNQNKVSEALSKLDFLCVCELFMSRIASKADIVIGVKSAYEKQGVYINAERRVRLSQPLTSSKELDDWELFAAIARELGHRVPASSEDIWREVTKSSPQYFGDMSYDALAVAGANGICWQGERLYEDRFATPSGLARFYHAAWQARGQMAAALSHSADGQSKVFYLTTGRVLEQYNNGAQTNETPRLAAKRDEDIVLISPADAAALDLGRRYELVSAYGRSAALKFRASDTIAEGTLFCSFHHARSRINYLFGDECDPHTHTPRFKAIEVAIEVDEEI